LYNESNVRFNKERSAMEYISNFIKERSAIAVILALVVGIALGITWGWVIQPVVWYDQPIDNLHPVLRLDYLSTTVDSYRVNLDENLAIERFKRLGPHAYATFQELKAQPGKIDPVVLEIFEQKMTTAGLMVQAAPEASDSPSILSWFFWVAIIALLLVGLAFGFYLFRGYRRSGGPLTAAQQAAEMTRSVEKTDYSATSDVPPVAQFVTTYVIGDDLFDDSFSIDSQSGEFLGECGVGISETIGVGDPKKVTAVEVWMFDKNDIQTVTKVLMSAHAFNDPNFRAKLESKGEMFLLEPQKQIMLETQTLQMIVTVVDAQYGQGQLPNQSYFERVTLELAIWSK
jgi:hypothetical protein